MYKIILFINIIIVIINIYFKYFFSLKEINLSFKNIDKVTINYFMNSYKNVSNLLNSKYIVNNNIQNKKERKNKKKISIYFIDYY